MTLAFSSTEAMTIRIPIGPNDDGFVRFFRPRNLIRAFFVLRLGHCPGSYHRKSAVVAAVALVAVNGHDRRVGLSTVVFDVLAGEAGANLFADVNHERFFGRARRESPADFAAQHTPFQLRPTGAVVGDLARNLGYVVSRVFGSRAAQNCFTAVQLSTKSRKSTPPGGLSWLIV